MGRIALADIQIARPNRSRKVNLFASALAQAIEIRNSLDLQHNLISLASPTGTSPSTRLHYCVGAALADSKDK